MGRLRLGFRVCRTSRRAAPCGDVATGWRGNRHCRGQRDAAEGDAGAVVAGDHGGEGGAVRAGGRDRANVAIDVI